VKTAASCAQHKVEFVDGNAEAFAHCSNPALPQQFEIKNSAESQRQRVVEPPARLLITGQTAGIVPFVQRSTENLCDRDRRRELSTLTDYYALD
jgi:hypothetical protein